MFRSTLAAIATAVLVTTAPPVARAQDTSLSVAVGPQYDTTHVYVPAADFDRFVASFVATFGGKTTPKGSFTVTPTPSKTFSQLILSPVGTISVFGFQTPIPYPFGTERTGYLVTDMDAAIATAKAAGAIIVVATFKDPVGLDSVIAWPGGVSMQLYWHTTAPNFPPLETIPENRVYVSPDAADRFVKTFITFAHGTIDSDVPDAPGEQIGRPAATYRRIRLHSPFGKMLVLATDGFLPYPYGRELTGYEVRDVDAVVARAKAAGATILVAPYTSEKRRESMVEFPGGYIAEIHSGS